LGWSFRLSLDFFARGLHTRTAVARLPLCQLGVLVQIDLNEKYLLLKPFSIRKQTEPNTVENTAKYMRSILWSDVSSHTAIERFSQ